MRLLSVTVKNFRMHEALTVTFDRSRTLVAGPNESGKSTLLEAIQRALFYPHRSTVDLEKIKPSAGGGPPEVVVQFERSGRTYTLRKIFKKAQATAELSDDTGGKQFSGDDAEAELRNLLGLGDGRVNQPLHGWSHLWVSQGESADDPMTSTSLDSAAQQLDARLNSLAGTSLTESKADSATYERIVAEHDKNYTSKGVRAGFPLALAKVELAAASAAATAAGERLIEFEDAADTVIREEDAIRSLRQTRADAEQHLEATRETLGRIEKLEKALEQERQELKKADDAYNHLRDGDAEIAALSKSLEDLRKKLGPKNEEIDRLRSHEKRMQNEVSQTANVTKQAFDSRQEFATACDLLRSVAKQFALETDRTDLGKKLSDIEAHAAAVAGIEKRLRELPEVDEDIIEDLEELDRQRQIGTVKLEAIATRLEVTCADVAVMIDGEPLPPGNERTLTDAADLRLGDGTTIRITPGGGQSLAELRVEIADLESKLRSRLTELGVASVAAAREAHESRQAAEAGRTRHQEKIESLGGGEVKTLLTEVEAAIEKVEADIARKTPVGFVRPADAATLEVAIQHSEQGQRQAEHDAQQAKAAYDAATAAAAAATQAREVEETDVADQRAEVQKLEIKRAALEQIHGTGREVELQMRAIVKKKAKESVDESERAIAALSPEVARRDKERFERTVDLSAREIVEAEKRMVAAKAILGRTGAVDLPGAKAAADARLDIASRRHSELLRRAEAVSRLRDLFNARRQAVAELVATPLRKKVAEYLEALYGPGCRFSITKAGGEFKDPRVARPSSGGPAFEFGSLSGGTKEQVAAACRLAMAELLAGGEEAGEPVENPCLPMVFDDAFVNSDPERIKAVHRVLELGASRGLQIIVLSCNPQEYAFFGATRFDMPKPKRGASAVVAPTGQDDETDGDDTVHVDVTGISPEVTEGRVPEGSDEALEAGFVAALGAMADRKAGNVTLRSGLGWDESTYERIKERLIAAGRVEKGKGRGGSVRILDASDSSG